MTKPLQVYMEEEDLVRLEAWSRERGWTKSQAVRAAVRAMTRKERTDPLLNASGMIDGLPADLSANFDRHLEETFVVTTPSSRPRGKASSRSRIRR